MLKRSPKSRYTTIAVSLGIAVALFIGIDSLLTFQALANSHGERKQYYVAKSDLPSGSKVQASTLQKKELFSNDAPSGALETSTFNGEYFAKQNIPSGVFLTKSMITKTAIETVDIDNRVMFVPTKDKLDSSIGTIADLMYVDPDGYGSEIVAYEAKILFDANTNRSDEISQDTNPGYFVEITSEEAHDLTTALATGDVRFALLRK